MDFRIEKKTLIQIIVVLVSLGFILESFALGSGRGGAAGEEAQETIAYAGVADVNLTVLDYRPYLYVDGLLNDTMKGELGGVEGVEDVIDDASRSVVSVSDSQKVPEVYSWLRRRNMISYTLATLGMPSYFGMTLANGSTVNVIGSRFDYMMEPVSKIGGKVLMRIAIETRGETPYGIRNVAPLLSSEQFVLNASISGASGRTFYYTVPWEGRGLDIAGLEEEFGAGNVEYARNDNVLLGAALTPQEMISKKFGYVTSISERSITAAGNFTDRARVVADFGYDAVFMNSSLVIRSDEEPALDFPHEVKYIYAIEIPEKIADYSFYANSSEVVTAGERNGTIPVAINASVLGETVVEIAGVEEKP
ncbi:MAG: hypothetical protein AB1657_01730 [Candidatus Micrarchaeota archaeon]